MEEAKLTRNELYSGGKDVDGVSGRRLEDCNPPSGYPWARTCRIRS